MASIRPPRLPWRRIAAFLPFLSCALALHTQSFDATDLHQPVDLNGAWMIHAGDDPAFAQSNFDDSHWTPFDVSKLLNDVFRDSHPPVVWYRLHVKVNPAQADLALLEHKISTAFEVYVNGKKLISAGTVSPFVPHTLTARLLAPIPPGDIRLGTLVIAIRCHISPYDWGSLGPGFTDSNLFIGQAAALRDHIWLVAIGEEALNSVVLLAGFALGIVCLALFYTQPSHREYLWIFLQFLMLALALPIGYYEVFHTVPVIWDQVKLLLQFGSSFFAILMYVSIVRMRMRAWMRAFFLVAFLGVVVLIIGFTRGVLSAATTQFALIPLALFAFGVMPFLLLVHWRRGNREAGILLIPLFLTGLTVYIQIATFMLLLFQATTALALRIGSFFFLSNRHVGPFSVNILNITSSLFVLSLSVIIVLRATRVSRQQALIESELAAAREVQQVILPEAIESVPGFHVESVYQPAQQVGGDFFQIIPTRDGGLLLVIGDVAGKGLPAAMLVSVLVGAVRGAAEYTSDPAELLVNLNECLIGRAGGGFSTALVARFYSHGFIAVANAGHLPPYLDGQEIELPGALPLGVAAGTQYRTTELHLQPAARMTFISDGIVEAQNPKGELLGFEQSLTLSTQSAQAIADAARRFGQKDDITVVTVQRASAPASRADSATVSEAPPDSADLLTR